MDRTLASRVRKIANTEHPWIPGAQADLIREIADALEEFAPQPSAPLNIQTHRQLMQLKTDLGVRMDWHEPDEQGVSARVVGDHLDNAMGSGLDHNHGELQVVITVKGEEDEEPTDIAVINLATLLCWATEGPKEF